MICTGSYACGPSAESRHTTGDIVGDAIEWFETRAEAAQFIAQVASEPNPEDAVIAKGLSVVAVEFELAEN